jgi:hypothetical protein
MKLRFVIAPVFAASLYLMQSPIAWACFCTGGEPQLIAHYKATSAVFVGTVTLLQRAVFSNGPRDPEQMLVAYLTVDETFKGISTKEVAVMTEANSSGGCGLRFQVGQQYLVFAEPPRQSTESPPWITPASGILMPIPTRLPTLATSVCDRSSAISYQQGALAMIRNFVRGVPQPQIDGVAGVYGYEFDGSFARKLQPLRDSAVVATANGQRFETRTRDDGSFLFENMPIGKYTVSAQFPAPYPPAIATVELESNEHRGEVYLLAKPSARLRGQLLGSDGRRLETGVAVSLIPLAATARPEAAVANFTRLFSGGRFEFREVPPGKYVLGISPIIPTPDAPYARTYYPHGDSVEAAEIFEVKLDLIDNLIFKLPPELQTQQIAGVAVAADGTPLSEAQVFLYDLEMPSRLAATVRFTDSAGRFKLFGLTGRRYQLQAQKFTDRAYFIGIQSQPVEVSVGEAPQEVRLLLDQEAILSPLKF